MVGCCRLGGGGTEIKVGYKMPVILCQGTSMSLVATGIIRNRCFLMWLHGTCVL